MLQDGRSMNLQGSSRRKVGNTQVVANTASTLLRLWSPPANLLTLVFSWHEDNKKHGGLLVNICIDVPTDLKFLAGLLLYAILGNASPGNRSSLQEWIPSSNGGNNVLDLELLKVSRDHIRSISAHGFPSKRNYSIMVNTQSQTAGSGRPP